MLVLLVNFTIRIIIIYLQVRHRAIPVIQSASAVQMVGGVEIEAVF